MNSITRAATALCLAALATSPLAAGAGEAPSLGAVEALRIATEAYVYGYPLVTFDMARRQQTNVSAPDGEHAPMGQMIRMRTVVLEQDLVLTPDKDGTAHITQDDVGNTYDRAGGSYSNFKP